LREQLVRLIELQKFELEEGRIQAKRKDLPARMKALEEEFELLLKSVEEKREQVENARKRRREKDTQLKTGQDALKRTREKLFEVKNNKEYQSMLKEIETFESKNSKIEDEVIVLLDEIERLEAAMKVTEQELNTKRCFYEEEKKKIEEEMNSLDGEQGECIRKGEDIKKQIPAEYIRRYQKIKASGRSVAVVSAWKEICSGCHMALPPQMYNELQKATYMMICPNCDRIIYWENRNEGSEKTPSARSRREEAPEEIPEEMTEEMTEEISGDD
jgi:predicted  nucleic acid-binding Zn-ribbon protein